MMFPIEVAPKIMNPGASNGNYPHCNAFTYFGGRRVIAFGSGDRIVIVSSSLAVIAVVSGHNTGSTVTALSWVPSAATFASGGTDLRVIIWVPYRESWVKQQEIGLDSVPICFSWSTITSEYRLCVSAQQFTIYQRADTKTQCLDMHKIYVDNVESVFCSHSRDSRFIMTLQGPTRDVVMYHRRERSIGYCKIPLHHPSRVKSARWRVSYQIHERCCFMTLAEDMVVRIWSETGVNEALRFGVVAAIPARHGTITASFIATTAELVAGDLIALHSMKAVGRGTYAYGHGHKQLYDRDVRFSQIADEREIKRAQFWILTVDKCQRLHIWELSGMAGSVRGTPTLTHLLSFVLEAGFDGIDFNRLYAISQLDGGATAAYEQSVIGKLASLQLITQNSQTNVLMSVSIGIEMCDGHAQKLTLNHMSRLHGHSSSIKTIRLNEKHAMMLTLDVNGHPCVWSFNDTDVYDPISMVKFDYEFMLSLEGIDWLKPSSQMIGYDGSNLVIITLPIIGPPIIKPDVHVMETNWARPGRLIRFVVGTEVSGGHICIAMFVHDTYTFWVRDFEIYMLHHARSESAFVDCTRGLMLQFLPYAGATVCFIAEKRVVYGSQITSTTITPYDLRDVIHFEKVLELDEDIREICVSHMPWLFVATERRIHICWRVLGSGRNFEIIQSIQLDFKLQNIVCLPTGLLAVVGNDRIALYGPVRKSTKYLESMLEWTLVASYAVREVCAIEWNLDGILMYAVNNEVHAFTKFMDTFFLEAENQKLPTFHHTVAEASKMVSDFHPSTLIPLAIGGKFKLLLEMLTFLDGKYDDSNARWLCSRTLLKMPDESTDYRTFVNNPTIVPMLERLADRIQSNPFPELSECENEQLAMLIRKIPALYEIPFDSLDERGVVVARALALHPRKAIPFDLIAMAHSSRDQKKLMARIDFSDWEAVYASGVLFWCDDLVFLQNTIVSSAMTHFGETSYLSILLLTTSRRYTALKTLFKRSGDDARAQFFMRDFTTGKNRSYAEKNGYSALRKHDYHIAAALFFLANRIDLSLKIIVDTVRDVGLAFFVARCYDNGIGRESHNMITQLAVPMARERQDFAAVAFFNKLMYPDSSISLSARFEQRLPHNMFEDSNYFCDQRFTTCGVTNAKLDDTANFVVTMLATGHILLCVQFLARFDTVMANIPVPNANIHGNGREDQMPRSFSANLMIFGCGHDLVHTTESNEQCETFSCITRVDSSENDISSSTSEELQEATPSSPAKVGFGFSLNDMSSSDYDQSSLQADSDDNSCATVVYPDSCKKDEKRANDRVRVSPTHRSVGRESTIRGTAILASGELDSYDLQVVDDNKAPPYDSTNWRSVLMTFSIARLRLENYLETCHDIAESGWSCRLHTQIADAGPQVSALEPHLMAYIMRLCKRRCFIYKRVLLLSDEDAKCEYMVDLCRCLSLLPEQIISRKFTAQQAVQVAQPVVVLMTFISEKETMARLGDERSKYIIGSIASALFFIALFFRDVELMIIVLGLDLHRLEEFPANISELLRVNIVPPGKTPYGNDHIVFEHSRFSFITEDVAQDFYVQTSNGPHKLENLPHFGASLFEFMLIDTFLRRVSDISRSCRSIFRKSLQFLIKLHDTCKQEFIYSTVNFPGFLRIGPLVNVKIDGHISTNNLLQFLLSDNTRTSTVHKFCSKIRDVLMSSTGRKVSPKISHLQQSSNILCDYRTPVHGIAMNPNGEKLLVACQDGLHTVDAVGKRFVRSSSQKGALAIEGLDDLGEELDLNRPENKNHEPWGPLASDRVTSSTVPMHKIPVCVAFNPGITMTSTAYSQAVIGYANGTVWTEQFGSFDTPEDTPCASVACQWDGSMMAAVHQNKVRCWNCYGGVYRSDPFMVLDTFSEETLSVTFLEGTGLTVTHQLASQDCQANLAFWDVLMPQACSMVASLELAPRYGRSECMSYSLRYKQIIVGTNTGNVLVIDTRQYQVISNIQTHSAKSVGVRAITTDSKQTYYATGSSDGTLRLWDLTTNQMFAERKGLHRAKAFYSRGKSRIFGITSIAICNDVIYTAGVDGRVTSTSFM